VLATWAPHAIPYCADVQVGIGISSHLNPQLRLACAEAIRSA